MTDAYRDDLEAALARVSDLEREIEMLRKRNAELESGDRETIEARENARRLAAALEREREELRRQQQWEADEAHWREASREEVKAVRAANAALKAELAPRRAPTTMAPNAGVLIGFVAAGIAALIAAIVGK